MTPRMICVALAATAFPTAFATPGAGQSAPPASGAVLVTAAEIRAAIPASEVAPVIDRTLRLVPVANDYNVAVSVVRRTRVDGRTPPDALSHDQITEVYHVLEGGAVMVTGGTLVDSRAMDPAGAVVRTLIGPSARGTAISGGTTREVGPGDVIVIPPGTAHGFVELKSETLRYLIVRIDPDQVLRPR